MKLLVLSSRPPWPPTRADQMTVDRMIRFFAGRGHEVDLACFTESAGEEQALREGLGDACRRIDTIRLPRWRSYASTLASLPTAQPMQVAYYRNAAMRRLVEERVAAGACDLVYVHLIRMTEYARKLAIPKAVGLQISQALNLERMHTHATDPGRRTFYRIEASKVRPYEANVCADFDQVFLVGQRDVEELRKSAPVRNAMVCPHGQDVPPLETVRAAPRESGAIVVSGVMATYTNVDAVTWFAKEIFPRVERAVPDASFWIVGRNPQRAVQDLARPPRVVVTGEVPDVYDWLCRASVGVAPLRIGAGMQNKLVQAMAAELPVVATTIANEGIGATPESEVLLRDDPDAFADAVIALLRDAGARQRIGRAARGYVEAHWTWEAHFEEMEKALLRIAQRAAGRA
jgi:polysaccharide biosynthesis protein PslH